MRTYNTVLIMVAFLVTILYACKETAPGREGAVPAPSNVRGLDYPSINPDLSVNFRIDAPTANTVQISIGGKTYDLGKGRDGVWTVTTEVQDAGFHYYTLLIDSSITADPASESFLGMGRMASAIEIPEEGADFYTLKDVPHGDIRSKWYRSETTGTWRRVNIYTPPGYDTDVSKRYPALYLQHGGGEDESGWAVQGKTDIILDNLIAEGKAVPMLVVITNGNAGQFRNAMGYNDEAMEVFKEELVENIIPFVEKNFRIIPDAENRALAGLSMGGGQSFYTGLRNPDIFASVGTFSTGLYGGLGRSGGEEFNPGDIVPGILTDAAAFNEKFRLFYISVGEQDPRIEPTQKLVELFREHGLEVEFASFPGAHEWQVWRKSLHDIAQRLFK